MGTQDDSTPKVRPLGEETPLPTSGPRTVVVVVLVAAVAGAIFLTTGPNQSPTGVAFPPVPTTSSTTTTFLPLTKNPVLVPDSDLALSARVDQLFDDANAIWDALPQADGEFVAVVGAPLGTDLVQVTRDSAQLQVNQKTLNSESIAFDQSGQHLAYTADSPNSDGPALYVKSDTPVPIRDYVASFAWHATIPGRIAWHELKTDELCWADVGGPEEPESPQCVPGPEFGARIVGFDSDGFIGVDNIGQTVSRYGFDGQAVASSAAVYAWPRSNGDILIIQPDHVNNRVAFTNVDGQLSNPTPLDWAPPLRMDEPLLVAVSPSVAYPEIAFITWREPQPRVQVFDSSGRLTHAIELGGWVTGIGWDSTGRYILMPGTLESEQVLHIYDISTSSLVTMSFGGWVHKALLATPVSCQDADHITEALAPRLVPDVTLHSAQLMKSRDAYLLEFSFLSGVVSGGPHDGAIATWALPGYLPSAEGDPPDRVVAINESARSLGIDTMDDVFEIDDWMWVDGVIGSQLCITGPTVP